MGKCLYGPVSVASRRHLREGVVAEHAHGSYLPVDTRLIGSLEAGRHSPPLVLRVPADREHEHLSPFRLIQVAARAVSRTYDPGDGNLDFVDNATVLVALKAAKYQVLAALENLVVTLQWFVIVLTPEVFYRCCGARSLERLRHPDALVTLVLFHVAPATDRIVDVTRRGALGRPRAEYRKYIRLRGG